MFSHQSSLQLVVDVVRVISERLERQFTLQALPKCSRKYITSDTIRLYELKVAADGQKWKNSADCQTQTLTLTPKQIGPCTAHFQLSWLEPKWWSRGRGILLSNNVCLSCISLAGCRHNLSREKTTPFFLHHI